MKIIIETIPHGQQRYPTVGDWRMYAPDALHIQVSKMGDENMEALVAIHELVEALLCDHRGISEPAVKAFDEAHLDHDDPGSLIEAPYHQEHMFAEYVERLLAAQLSVDWARYSNRVKALFA